MLEQFKCEWEYASIELTGNTVTGVNFDAQTAEGMRGETMEELSGHLANSDPDLLSILNTLGEEGWEIAEKLERGAGVVHLLLKKPGNRREQKDAATRALMKKALDDMDL